MTDSTHHHSPFQVYSPRPTHLDYAEVGFRPIPIIPPGAKLTPGAADKIPQDQLGKNPGMKYSGGWAGVKGWNTREFSPAELEEFTLSGAGVGLLCGVGIVGVDIDVDDPVHAGAIRDLAERMLGKGPVRTGRAPRAMMVYAAPHGIRSRKIKFRDGDREYQVDLLGRGRQFVAEGIHPKTGKPYSWDRDLPGALLSAVSADQLQAFMDEVLEYVDLMGLELTGTGGAGGDVEVDQDSLKAADLQQAERVVRAMRNTDELEAFTGKTGRDHWVHMAYAFKGAFQDDPGLGEELWLDWCDRWEVPEDEKGNDPEESRRVYDRCVPPYRVGGWRFLKGCAYFLDPQEPARQAAEVFGGDDVEPLSEAEGGDDEEGLTRSQKLDRLVRRVGVLPSEKSVLYFDAQTRKTLGKEVANDRFARIFGTTSGAKAFSNQFALHPDRLFVSGGQSYAPGKPAIFEHPVSGLLCANTYQPGPAHMPGGWASRPGGVTEEDIAIWLRLLERVIPDPDERFVLINWMAWQVQRVGQKCNWGPLIRGEEGNGKDSLLLPLSLGLGGNCITLDYKTTIMSQYNDWIVGKSLILWGEIKGDNQLVNMLKQYMAAASDHDMLRISHKYVGGYEYPNVANHLLMSNYKDALQLTVNSRRVFVTDSGTDRGFPGEFYHEYRAWLERGASLVWRWLRDWSITVDMKGRAPASKAKEEMAYMTQSPLGHEIHRMIEEREGPCARDLVTVEELADWANPRLRGHKNGATPVGCGKVLGGVDGAAHFRTDVEKKTIRIWAVRNRERYEEMHQTRGTLVREWARQKAEVPSRLDD